MKVLITGASGFIGRSFVDSITKEENLVVTGIGRRNIDLPDYISHDLRNPLDFLPGYRPDVVIHGAALSSPWGSKGDFYENNVKATANVVDFCEKRSVKRLVYISSSSVYYNDNDQYNIDERTPIGPSFINEYARTKYLGEKLVEGFRGEHVILRPRAVFGPGDTVLFPRILRAATAGKLPIIQRDGPPARGDLLYIDNLIDWMKKAVILPDLQGAFNLTNGDPVVIQDFLFDIFRRLDIKIPDRKVSYKKALIFATMIENIYRVFAISEEPPVTRFGIQVFSLSKTFDARKTLETLGKPTTSLEEGVNRFIEWQKRQRKSNGQF